ncbi:WecB/TagA/CpsF family glycosyltransferase [Stakelama sp. CBK3Z-3]|uniref:WecB/TagA/CpsF family glycosyltransferase n=1 Tax=Stakelama flava TaxID=2860338 RepID=A0ABS6XJ66_9SPHN|nr:WecB/TagA/CpsF family glycosyltransferase [Stakelama flava]MBW4330258.1 WecB/TagA/CpsF family glycosyltransferase [Stakelama flava]
MTSEIQAPRNRNSSNVRAPARQLAPIADILGVPVSRITIPRAIALIRGAIDNEQSQYICVRDVHGVMHALRDPEMMEIQREAGLVTPDGMPLVWVARARGYDDIDRVCGADLMEALCEATRHTGIGHFFYGGREGVAEALIAALTQRFPGMTVAGHYCPPFRPLTPEEDAMITAQIRESGAKIVWVGISTPKQELWMRDHVTKLPGVTLLGVGAAFDFHAGMINRAPVWMRARGLEWAHRLASEPRRLWRRYLIMAPQFVIRVARESWKLRRR